MTHDLPDYYAALGVSRSASPAEIAHAYRCRIRRHHPDVRSDNGSDELREVVAAYTVLRDPARRASYDRQRQDTPAAGAPPATRRGPLTGLLRVGPVRYHGPAKETRTP